MDISFAHAILNTLLIGLLTILLAVPVGSLFALLLVRTNVYGRSWAYMLLCSQLAIPLYVFAGGWSAAVGLQGWVRVFWPSDGSLTGAWNLLAVAGIHTLAAIPWVMLIFSLGMIYAHRGDEESAVVEGGLLHWLRNVQIPKLRIWGMAACLWCLFPILTEMVVTNLYQVPSVAEQVYLDASRGAVTPWTYIAAVLFCAAPILGLGVLWTRRAPRWALVIAKASHHRAAVFDLRNYRLAVSVVCHLSVLFLVGLPILSLILKAGWTPSVSPDGSTSYGWSLSRFVMTVRESMTLFTTEFTWSFVIGVASTAVALVMASTLLAFGGRSSRLTTGVSFLMIFLVAIPGPLVGMLVIFLLNRESPPWLGVLYDDTILAPVLAQQFRLLPLAWLLVLAIVASISTASTEQAAVDGLSRIQWLRLVVLPQAWRPALGSALLLFVLSVGELSCSILVLPAGVTTVSMRLFEMLHFGMRHQDSGLCGALVLLAMLMTYVCGKTLRER